MRANIFIEVYSENYPEDREPIFKLDDWFEFESIEDAKRRAKNVVNSIMLNLYPNNLSSSGVRYNGDVWTYTDVI